MLIKLHSDRLFTGYVLYTARRVSVYRGYPHPMNPLRTPPGGVLGYCNGGMYIGSLYIVWELINKHLAGV